MNGFIEVGDGVVEIVFINISISTIVVCVGVVGLELDGFIEVSDGAIEIAFVNIG